MYKAIAIVAVIVIFRWQHQPATTMVATLRTTATKWYMRHIRWGYIVNECHCTHLLAGGFASGGFAGGLLGSGHGDGVVEKLVLFVRELVTVASKLKLWQKVLAGCAPGWEWRPLLRNSTKLRRDELQNLCRE